MENFLDTSKIIAKHFQKFDCKIEWMIIIKKCAGIFNNTFQNNLFVFQYFTEIKSKIIICR